MKRLTLFFSSFIFFPLFLGATHNIAGNITVACVGPMTYEVTVTTYTNTASVADRCSLDVNWGDGFFTTADRLNGPTGSACPSATMGDITTMINAGYQNTKENIYKTTHTYSGASTYTISIIDPNRVAGIVNIPNSVNVPFYLQTVIIVDPIIGCNSTPILTSYPLDKACIGHCFWHNPGAVDPDNDSLSYDIGSCLDTNGLVIAGYLPISNWGYATIDHVTGDLSWCSPTVPGKFNLVIEISEWKRFPNGTRLKIGTVYRDMSIDVDAHCNNDNPDIPDLPDTCVVAGDTVNMNFTVTDPNNDQVKVIAYGGPFNVTPTATINPDNIFTQVPFNESFRWVTTCDRVRLQPWIVTFKATDNDPDVPLLDLESTSIIVVSPGPSFLTATPQGTSMTLNWGQNPCDPPTNHCKGYRIFRREGCNTWTHGPCETGVPSYTGYVLIGTVYGITTTTFVDDNGGAGLIPGVDYSYRVCGFFYDAAESFASPEACAELLRDVPVITNVDVVSTGASDTIFVKWENAIPDNVNFDTTIHPGMYRIELRRSQGFNYNAATANLIATFNDTFFTHLPTHYFDVNDNTVGTPYSYRLAFYAASGNDSIGSCQPASSVFLAAVPSDNRVSLSWQYNVPWANTEAAIYRQNLTNPLQWDSLGTAPGNSYVDDSLENGVQYCYYVDTHGSYNNPTLPLVDFNRSQRTCATPEDLTPPCAPVLVVNSDCFTAQNQLIWTDPDNMNCGTDDVVQYDIWYTPIEGGTLSLLTTLTLYSDTTIVFTNMMSVAGCYAITALDTFNNQSPYSNVICVDNCPNYELPNVFTPNGDGTNDFFIPFPYQYIKDVDVKIYDRWGALVYETTNPDVHWDGRDMKTGKLCTDGVYYYTAMVDEIHLSGIVPRELKGFVHLFGRDVGQFH
ncbi:MAG: gliding motility-associated C-terminal domain-containing protein [Bacteroidetes bacterium]|nr:gliding motility-associated C-terminal domain-containing protein [Bacteroidota bacterium]